MTSNQKRLLLNKQLDMNVILKIVLNQIFILPVHKLKTTPLLIILEIPNMKHIYHQLTMSGEIIQENTGKNI